MKPVILRNKLNGEEFICSNLKQVDVIDGVEYLIVNRYGSDRSFLMRKDVLEKVSKVNKEKTDH